MPQALDEPLGVVAGDELSNDPPRLGEMPETIEIEALLLECAHEALDGAVALGLEDVRWRDRHPKPLDLIDPGVGDVLRAPVAPDPKSARHVLRGAPADLADPLAQGLERGPAIANLRGVPADQLGDAMIDGAEEPTPAVPLGIEPGGIRPPHPLPG